MCYAKKTIASAMNIVKEHVAFTLAKHDDWVEGCTLKLFMMFTHVNVALTRPQEPQWIIDLLGLQEQAAKKKNKEIMVEVTETRRK